MKLLFAAVLAGVATATAPAMAADLFGSAPPPMSFPASDGPTAVEIGSSWYIRGDIGMSWDQVPSISINSQSVPPTGNATTPIGVNEGQSRFGKNLTLDAGVGYRFNDYFRMDATYEYRNGSGASSQSTVVCPYNSTAFYLPGNLDPLGVAYNTSNTCNGELNVNQWNNMFLGNAYVDLGNYYGVTPYVGAGAGLNVNTTSGSLDFFETANGQTYGPDLTLTPTLLIPPVWVNPKTGKPITPAPNIAFAAQDWNRNIRSTHYSFAFALMAGIGYQLTPSATLDIGYRFLDTGATTLSFGSPGGTGSVKGSDVSQEVRIGIRYAIQ
jgi:opacity protein-like surface antigen